MQTLKERDTYTPTDASQVRSNCDLPLNREETLSVAGLKTSFNNPDVNQLQRTGGLKATVFALSKEGFQLMPCTPAKARKLLNKDRAKVIKRKPFVIQLNFVCENQVQGIKFGEDSGYKCIGYSAITAKKEVTSGVVEMDNKTSSRLTDRTMYRKNRKRRNRRYRQARFLNRKKNKGWLPPSLRRKVDTHISVVTNHAQWLPITSVRVELGSFDIQKLMNPDISGIEYQQGNLYGYENQKSYIIVREHGKCQLCGKEKGSDKWRLHHIIERTDEGTDRPENIALLHEKCHAKLHKKGMKLQPAKQFKAETFMSIVRKYILDGLKKHFDNVEVTFGYETYLKRNELGLPKSHVNDAFVIAGGTTQERCKPLNIIQKHRNNRSLGIQRKGFAPASRKQRYSIQPKDLIWIDGKKHIASGVHNNGTRVISETTKKSYAIKKVERVFNFGSFVYS